MDFIYLAIPCNSGDLFGMANSCINTALECISFFYVTCKGKRTNKSSRIEPTCFNTHIQRPWFLGSSTEAILQGKVVSLPLEREPVWLAPEHVVPHQEVLWLVDIPNVRKGPSRSWKPKPANCRRVSFEIDMPSIDYQKAATGYPNLHLRGIVHSLPAN